MGYFFALEHANIVAYLTAPTAAAPRASRADVAKALDALAHGSDGIPSVISRDGPWVTRLKQEALEASERVGDRLDVEVPAAEMDTLLGPLRRSLSAFDVYALLVDDQRDRPKSDEIGALAKELAYSSKGNALFLMPLSVPGSRISVLDPIPAFAEALEHPDRWPGLLFWTASGTAAMVSLDDLSDIAQALRDGHRERLEDAIRTHQKPDRRPRRLLHLSDLHFGSKSVTAKITKLEAQLHRTVPSVDRVVITGDLFDTPSDSAADYFRSFEAGLRRLTSHSPILIPGNHDIRIKGNFGSFYQQIAGIGVKPVVVDEEIGVTFTCFNSSESGVFARGQVSAEQLERIGGALENEIASNPRIEDHLAVALVHHHPFSFRTAETRTFVQRALAVVGLNEETFLEMKDADRFLDWCARWRVSAVLHGHKHVARHMSQWITPEGAAPFEVSAIGCGSSLGAEGSPQSYVVLNWDERSGRWSTSFFESRNAGPFIRQAVTVTAVPN